MLSWKSGKDNNSPVQIYSIQTRTPFSVGWQAVSTGEYLRVALYFVHVTLITQKYFFIDVFILLPVPEVLNGRTHKATVVDLSPWVEYEFRVVASNSVGTGEPSKPSALLKTKPAGKSLVSPRFFNTGTLPVC